MMMVETTAIPASVLPLADLADHLRLSRGFSDDAEQDAQLEACLLAAIAAIESRIGKALFRRGFLLSLIRWPNVDCHTLPLAPVTSVDAITLIADDGAEDSVAPSAYDLLTDTHAPSIQPVGRALTQPKPGGRIEIAFTAGYSDAWDGLAADLKQAVITLAGAFWAQDIEPDGGLPMIVSILLQPYRRLRLTGCAS